MKHFVRILLVYMFVIQPVTGPAAGDPYDESRQRMVAQQIEARDVRDPSVLSAMRKVPRHHFALVKEPEVAYADRPLPVGYGQTISQPYIVAYMTEALRLTGLEKVLEIGTGSGYQAAILAETAGEVYSMEIIPALYRRTKLLMRELGYGGVHLAAGDGYYGWPEASPFDGIIVTCAADHIPPPLIQQLKPGGRMVIPVGPAWAVQTLMLVEKTMENKVRRKSLLQVRFVPLTREKGATE